MAEYIKVFKNPYPSGWENLPSERTEIDANSLQQYTNSVVSIEEYLSDYPIPQKTSELYNDEDFVKRSETPKKTSDLLNDSGYITKSDVPNKVSDLNNDEGFITKAVNDLVNYFTKDQTYSKIQLEEIISNLNNWTFKIVSELPSENISNTTVYCVPKDSSVVFDDLQNLDLFNEPVENPDGSGYDLGSPIFDFEEVE